MGKFDDIKWKWLEERGIEVYGDPYQLEYMINLWKHPDMIKALWVEGKAGTGKTHLATLAGAYEVQKGNYKKIMYIRNSVPVRNSGFVKGSPEEKNKVYMEPFISALDHVQPALYEYWKEKEIAVAITADHIRGATWNDSFIIIDECQNFDMHELRTVLTRVGKGSKVVVSGSRRQVDNKVIKRIGEQKLLPYEVFKEHFRGEPRVTYHTLEVVYRDWFAGMADDVDFTIDVLEGRL